MGNKVAKQNKVGERRIIIIFYLIGFGANNRFLFYFFQFRAKLKKKKKNFRDDGA